MMVSLSLNKLWYNTQVNELDVRLDPLGIFSKNLSGFVDELVGDLGRKIQIYAPSTPTFPEKRRGLCTNYPGISRIVIAVGNIDLSCGPFGGTLTYANTLVHAAHLILAHELRHAWQFTRKGHPVWDDSLTYEQQPHEVDAFSFVNDASRYIHDFVSVISKQRCVA